MLECVVLLLDQSECLGGFGGVRPAAAMNRTPAVARLQQTDRTL